MDCPHCERRFEDRSGPYRGGPRVVEKVALVEEIHEAGVTVARCPSCTGAFATHEAMQAVDAFGYNARRNTSPTEMMRRASAEPTRRIACPACDGETTRREWSFATLVYVDVCIECRGVWMDAGELEALDGTAAKRR